MADPNYADRINSWDHNVVCRSLIEARSDLTSKIQYVNGPVRYNGVITIELLGILER
jgi:hypothetical protein